MKPKGSRPSGFFHMRGRADGASRLRGSQSLSPALSERRESSIEWGETFGAFDLSMTQDYPAFFGPSIHLSMTFTDSVNYRR